MIVQVVTIGARHACYLELLSSSQLSAFAKGIIIINQSRAYRTGKDVLPHHIDTLVVIDCVDYFVPQASLSNFREYPPANPSHFSLLPGVSIFPSDPPCAPPRTRKWPSRCGYKKAMGARRCQRPKGQRRTSFSSCLI